MDGNAAPVFFIHDGQAVRRDIIFEFSIGSVIRPDPDRHAAADLRKGTCKERFLHCFRIAADKASGPQQRSAEIARHDADRVHKVFSFHHGQHRVSGGALRFAVVRRPFQQCPVSLPYDERAAMMLRVVELLPHCGKESRGFLFIFRVGRRADEARTLLGILSPAALPDHDDSIFQFFPPF